MKYDPNNPLATYVPSDESVESILARPYLRVLVADEEGGFSASIEEFPGCFAQGETSEEATDAINLAAHSWLEAAQAQRWKIPEPFKRSVPQ